MFSKSQTRITLLTLGVIASWMLFYFDGFAGLAPDWQWRQAYQAEVPAVVVNNQRLSSFQQGVLITGASDAIHTEYTKIERDQNALIYHYDNTVQIDLLAEHGPPLLNLQISPDTTLLRLILEAKVGRGTIRNRSYDERATIPVSQVIIEENGQLRVSARFLGYVAEQQCDAQGHCLIVFGTRSYSKDAVFYSADGGRHWRWLSQWREPEDYQTSQLLGLVGAQSVLLVQQGKLYRSDDLGQHWQPLFDLPRLLTERGIDPALYAANWYYNGGDRVIVSNQPQNTGGEESLTGSLLLDFNLRSARVQASQWVNGEIIAADISPQGEVDLILRQLPRQLYSLNRWQENGTLQPLLETGKKTLGTLYAGNHLLMMNKEFNDPLHMTVSTDDGQHWFRMKKLPDSYDYRVQFDRWRNRLFRFPTHDYNYPKLGNGDGLVYETATPP
ncbi:MULTISPECIES: hypothetical protein [unclassified Serratia (in: enterobacteria)]|uniref:hypothetical protein n=1 Tax=unclassified Serratia (in: enterobacteria) TaxID=2647522 RepID=UPI0004680FCD|nr:MULTISPECIES: hypothetical protein [unclassified Serratia (in: enterobacteria)]